MDGRSVERIERGIDTLAAGLISAAIAFAVATLLRGIVAQPQLLAFAAVALAASYLICVRLLAKAGSATPRFALPEFAPAPLPLFDELVMTDADRVPVAAEEEPLELDDILAEIGPDSRVVRLFDRAAMPTAGQLKARIDRHLDEGSAARTRRDDSEALFEALAELRRSLA
jgi:hypothetical protein